MPPVAPVTLLSVCQFCPSEEASIRKSLAYAASQLRSTSHRSRTAPRSTRTHWGSEAWLDQRVPGSPSKAAAAGVPAFSTEEAAAGLPCAALALSHEPPGVVPPVVPKTWNSHRE